MELIDKQKLLADLHGLLDVLSGAGDPFLANIMLKAIGCVERQPIVVLNEDVPELDTSFPV